MCSRAQPQREGKVVQKATFNELGAQISGARGENAAATIVPLIRVWALILYQDLTTSYLLLPHPGNWPSQLPEHVLSWESCSPTHCSSGPQPYPELETPAPFLLLPSSYLKPHLGPRVTSISRNADKMQILFMPSLPRGMVAKGSTT